MQVIGNYTYIITSLHRLQEFHSERNNTVKLAAITKVLQNQEDRIYYDFYVTKRAAQEFIHNYVRELSRRYRFGEPLYVQDCWHIHYLELFCHYVNDLRDGVTSKSLFEYFNY